MSVQNSAYNYVHPFCKSKFCTKSDLEQACVSLLDSLIPFFSPGHARIKIGATATHYDETAAEIEGYARPLYALAPLIAGGYEYDGTKYWVDGLINGTDPEHAEYWGEAEDMDQRMVEMCPISISLIMAPKVFWDPLTQEQRQNVANWLGSINKKEIPDSNWLWFRIFANLALKKGNMRYSAQLLETDLNRLDSFYVADGFFNDGPTSNCQIDYYSGSFAIQFLQLVYTKLVDEDEDPERCRGYRERAILYANAFLHYFDPDGSAIPFGRSLTYRFAMVSFWPALSYAFSSVPLPPPMTHSLIKGLLMRNLRWWAKFPTIFSLSGTLTIGYVYPQLYASENYNSPQSPYWACLSFLPLCFPSSHPFWKECEAPYPSTLSQSISVLKAPNHIVVHAAAHTFLLSAGQACRYPLKATHAKYGKFAYSAKFGFSVPSGGHTFSQYALDSVLAFSLNKGLTWYPPLKSNQADIVSIQWRGYQGDSVSVLKSQWKPVQNEEIDVTSYLVPPDLKRWPAWHIRVHHIRTSRAVQLVESGFAIHALQKSSGRLLPMTDVEKVLPTSTSATVLEGRFRSATQALLVSQGNGASGIAVLVDKSRIFGTDVEVADPNTNLMSPKTAIPLVTGSLKAGEDVWIANAVFAVGESADLEREWKNSPQVDEEVLKAFGLRD